MLKILSCLAPIAVLMIMGRVQAQEIGHFNGGVMNLRDYIMPDTGFYFVAYNYFYSSRRMNNPSGEKIESVNIKGATVGLEVNVKLYGLAPTLIWVTNIKSLGIKYGAVIMPQLMNANLDALLLIASVEGGQTTGGSFGLGDLYAQPFWVGKATTYWDFSLAYGFYTPTGKYNIKTVNLPGGPVETEDSGNLGYGFWTHQFQGVAAWYPQKDKKTALVITSTYEVHGKKKNFDVTPGHNFSLNWGVSRILHFRNNANLNCEVGLTGYDSWQTTIDTGSMAKDTRDQVHAVGGQFGVTFLPRKLSFTSNGFIEYDIEGSFSGGVNLRKREQDILVRIIAAPNHSKNPAMSKKIPRTEDNLLHGW